MHKYDEFVTLCRAARCRPPSLYAYFARCLGVVLAPQPELLATRFGRKLLIPSRIDVATAVELHNSAGEQVVVALKFHALEKRVLEDINDEMKARFRHVKRADYSSRYVEGFPYVSRWASPWLSSKLKKLRASTRRRRYDYAANNACVHLSSTTSWLNGKNGWGVQLYVPAGLSITLSGWSRRAVVVDNDQIVVRPCLDVAIHFNHAIVDGAPATRFAAALTDEVESGRILSEFPIVPRARKSSP